MVKDQSVCQRRNPLEPLRVLVFPISSKGEGERETDTERKR